MIRDLISALLGFILGGCLMFYIIEDTYNQLLIDNQKTAYEPIYIDQWGNAYDFVKEK